MIYEHNYRPLTKSAICTGGNCKADRFHRLTSTFTSLWRRDIDLCKNYHNIATGVIYSDYTGELNAVCEAAKKFRLLLQIMCMALNGLTWKKAKRARRRKLKNKNSGCMVKQM
ncbi:uncharacterized protein LOC123553454 [Mercenaria mercenaria]|uniref:uncharacterized protein LOC123553454 n=1 Tax=Mercenaria mercenaria TaxID=6596 RepID=UPI00234EC00A|nr:uncharacterized protein LOC123553454 [Mercenaria mercenaria]